MARFLIVFVIFISGAACAAAPKAPKIDLHGLVENNYPCIAVRFPEQIRYEGMKTRKSDDDFAMIYNLALPNYRVEVLKLYSRGKGWSTETLPSLYDNASKVYEISDMDNTPEKSAVITLEEIKGDLYLKGSVAEFMQADRAIRVDVYRMVKKMGVFRNNVIDNWKNSTTGNRSIENMKTIVDYIYYNIKAVECEYKENIDSKWWE